MAEGLTLEELDAIAPSSKKGDLSIARADDIRKEIFRRHGIPEHRSLQEAIDRINMQAQLRNAVGNDGGSLGGWANPEERGDGRYQYAAAGDNPQDAQKRWDESIHALDPQSYEYMQRFGRDLDFLESEAGQERANTGFRSPRRTIDANAIRIYDANEGEQLARRGVYGDPFTPPSGGYQRWAGWGPAMMNAVNNPDTGSGSYLTWSEQPASTILHRGSGETSSWGEASGRASANYLENVQNKTSSPTPVADFPVGYSPSGQERADRIRELRDQSASAMLPMASERWYRSTGYAPPGWVTDPLEAATRAIDPSLFLTGALAGKALAAGGRAMMRPVAASIGRDMMQEQAFDQGISTALGGEPGRSGRQFFFGGGKPGEDFLYKTDEEVAQSRKDASAIGKRVAENAERVSRAEREAYQRLQASGALGQLPQIMAQSRKNQ